MKYREYLKYTKAVDLLREHRQNELFEFIKRRAHASGASYKLFTNYSVTGIHETKMIGESTVEDLMDTIFPFGIKKSDLEPFMDKAELLVEASLGPE